MKKTLLASAVLMAVAASASANPIELTSTLVEDLDAQGKDVVIQSAAGTSAIGEYKKETHLTNAGAVTLTATIYSYTDSKGVYHKDVGFAPFYLGTTSVEADSVTIVNKGQKGSAITSYGTHTITANNITLEADGDALQGSGDMNGSVTLKATDTITIRSTGTDGEAVQGFKGQFNLKAKKVVLESVGGQAIAQRDQGATTIEAEELVINAYQGGKVDDKEHAVRVNKGTLTLNVNSLTVSDNDAEGTAAIGVDGDSAKLVLQADKATIDGDIVAATGEVQLDGELVFKGDKAEIANMTGDKATFTMTKADQEIAINNANEDLTLAATGDVNDEAGVDALKKIALTGNTDGVKIVAYEGMNSKGTTAELDAEGNLTNVVETTNSIMSNTLDLASAAPLAMNRLLMNDVRKRMGDLRAAEGTHGVWARYDGGKLSGERGLENDFTTVQVGIDTVPVVDAPRFGVAFAYTKSDADMLRGSADMDAFSLAFYGTKFYDNGMFVDVIGRMATADTDIVVDGDKKGSMDNVALSLSGELGWRFDVTDKFYFEPQAELTYTYVNADTLTLSEGSSYKFDSVDSLMGRVGFAAGFKCPANKGDVYVRASAVHEFLGDAAVTGGKNIHEVDGEDTWVEFGIGGQFNINKNTYVYADIERTEGAKLEEDWRANVGVRYAF